MKKLLAYVLAFVLTLVIMLPSAFAETTSPSPDPSESASSEASPDSSASPSESDNKNKEFKGDDEKVASVLLIDVNTKKALYKKNPDKTVFPASTTKIMTSLLTVEKGDLGKKITVGSEIRGFSSASSLLDIKEGEEISLKDLLYGMMLVSGNDAACTIAKDLGGSIDGFAQMMNAKAKELGMDNTNFVNPHGVHKDASHNTTTASDMAKLTLFALKNSKWKDVFTKKEYKISETNKNDARTVYTTNKLLYVKPDKEEDKKFVYQYAEGGKTGIVEINNVNNGCLVALAKNGDRELLALIYGDPSSDADHRFDLAKQMFEWGFSQPAPVDITSILSIYTIPQKIENASELDEENGTLELVPDFKNTKFANLSTEDLNTIKNNPGSVQPVKDITRNAKAPVKKGDVFGTVSFQYNGKPIATANLIASREVAASGEEAAGASASSSASSPLQKQKSKELFTGQSISPWWWLLVPFVLGVIILLRVMTVNKRQRSRFKNKRKVYNYRIK